MKNRVKNIKQTDRGVKVYNARILVGRDGTVKISGAEEKVKVNQRSDWELHHDTRELARLVKRQAKANKIFV